MLSYKYGTKVWTCLHKFRKWLRTAKNLCPSEEAKEFRLDSLENEITALENECSGDYHWIGFCHNDLQYGNIMIDEETKLLTIIVNSCYSADVWFTNSVFSYTSFLHFCIGLHAFSLSYVSEFNWLSHLTYPE